MVNKVNRRLRQLVKRCLKIEFNIEEECNTFLASRRPPEIRLAPSSLEDVVALRAEDHDALVKVVVLHGGGGVEDGERRVHLGLEGVVGAAVVQVVAQARHQKAEDLQ